MKCKICQAESVPAFKAKILKKYDVNYFCCGSCGFIQTEEPYWLAEAYSSAINEIDIGLVWRGITSTKLSEGIILSTFDKNGRFIDFGGGYGLLVRLMRDQGFDFYWSDPYCDNLFAKHFVAEPGTQFELLTAFEVFEHLVDPLAEIGTMLEYSPNLLFSTVLVPQNPQVTAEWWYFDPDHGQHIAFYTVPALQAVAKRFNRYLATNGVDTHLLSQKPVSPYLLRFFGRQTLFSALARRLLRRGMRKKTLFPDDWQTVTGGDA